MQWLKQYENHLRTKHENKPNTIHGDLKIIRRLFNDAISEDLVPIEKNPFLKHKLKWEQTQKEFLTEEELFILENFALEKGSRMELHRNAYIFAAYAGGLRFSDIVLMKWENFDGERVLMSTQKTGSVVSIKLPPKALEILNLYSKENQTPDDYVFPFLDNDIISISEHRKHKAIHSVNTQANKDLKEIARIAEIKKNIHFHTSRHTWATRALKKGMRIEYVSKLMGHTSIKTTQIYAKIVNEELDKAMEVFNEPIPAPLKKIA